MPLYNVRIARHLTKYGTLEVEADDLQDARSKAYTLADDADFDEPYVDDDDVLSVETVDAEPLDPGSEPLFAL